MIFYDINPNENSTTHSKVTGVSTFHWFTPDGSPPTFVSATPVEDNGSSSFCLGLNEDITLTFNEVVQAHDPNSSPHFNFKVERLSDSNVASVIGTPCNHGNGVYTDCEVQSASITSTFEAGSKTVTIELSDGDDGAKLKAGITLNKNVTSIFSGTSRV